jgi:hypothetical protein
MTSASTPTRCPVLLMTVATRTLHLRQQQQLKLKVERHMMRLQMKMKLQLVMTMEQLLQIISGPLIICMRVYIHVDVNYV